MCAERKGRVNLPYFFEPYLVAAQGFVAALNYNGLYIGHWLRAA